jgi:REP element-mobilizing transposase RayT
MWNETDTPLAYLISFRTHGSWLHGDQRGSIDRFHNSYGSSYIRPNESWRRYNEQLLRTPLWQLDAKQRHVIKDAVIETCKRKRWGLLAVNVRTNHVHAVVSANDGAARVLNALKANATRRLREDGLWTQAASPWADKGSKRNLWNEESVAKAVDYVLNRQGEDLPDFGD